MADEPAISFMGAVAMYKDRFGDSPPSYIFLTDQEIAIARMLNSVRRNQKLAEDAVGKDPERTI